MNITAQSLNLPSNRLPEPIRAIPGVLEAIEGGLSPVDATLSVLCAVEDEKTQSRMIALLAPSESLSTESTRRSLIEFLRHLRVRVSEFEYDENLLAFLETIAPSVSKDRLEQDIVYILPSAVENALIVAIEYPLKCVQLLDTSFREEVEKGEAPELPVANRLLRKFLTEHPTFTNVDSDTGATPLTALDVFKTRDVSDSQTNFGGDIKRSSQVFQEAWSAYRNALLREDLNHLTIPRLDGPNYLRDVKVFGAKGQALQMLREDVRILEHFTKMYGYTLRVPEFTVIPTSVFMAWRTGENIRERLVPFYDWINHREVMLRSSAVFSEDAATSTGAGIYLSSALSSKSRFDEFVKEVEQIYESVTSDKAIGYRTSLGISEELMAVVIQERVSDHPSCLIQRKMGLGYLNSQRPHHSHLLEVVSESGMRSILKKEQLYSDIALGSNILTHGSLFAVQPDYEKFHGDFDQVLALGALGLVTEALWKTPLQIEFLQTEQIIYLLQARPLPAAFLGPCPITFSDETPCLEQRDALGVGDLTLRVLSSEQDNSQQEGFVVFDRSHRATENDFESRLPKAGAVLVRNPSVALKGHIETLALERRLILLYTEGEADYFATAFLHREWELARLRMSPSGHGGPPTFEGFSYVRVVSNGLKGRVYGAEDPTKPSSNRRSWFDWLKWW